MWEIDVDDSVSESPNFASENTLFDASKYDFFGNNVIEEVELGGLEEDDNVVGLVDSDDKNYQTFHIKDRGELNRTVSEPRIIRNVRGRGSFSRGSSFAADWAHEPEFSNWIDHHILDAENAHDTNRWSSHPFTVSQESKPFHRTASYPQPPPPQRQQSIPTEHVHILKSPFTSYPPQVMPPVPFSPPRFAGEDIVQFGPTGIPMNPGQPNPNHWPNQAGLPPGLHHSNGLTHHRLHRMQPSHDFSNLQSQLHDSHPPMNGMAESREQGMRPLQSGRQNTRFPQQVSDGRPQFRSKHMSADEIDSILRIQHAATHSNDPYVDDYYHQARLAKKFSGSNSRPGLHFCPTSIWDLPSHTKASSEPHAYLQVDALGRIPFSSIHRPRPLLEVDVSANSNGETLNPIPAIKPLEPEPMLVARIIVEDGVCLLLDVNDIDRLLPLVAPQDGGANLRQRRRGLLEGLAASLQLVDPLGHGIAPKDDLMFLRIVSLPKGRKLLSRCIELLYPATAWHGLFPWLCSGT